MSKPKTKKCKKCGVRKKSSEFRTTTYLSKKTGKLSTSQKGACKSCNSKSTVTTDRKNKHRRYYVMYHMIQTVGGCEVCGEMDIRKIEWDHLNDKEKVASVSRLLGSVAPWSVLWEEISKCRILCSNCHKVHTAKQHSHYSHEFMESLEH